MAKRKRKAPKRKGRFGDKDDDPDYGNKIKDAETYLKYIVPYALINLSENLKDFDERKVVIDKIKGNALKNLISSFLGELADIKEDEDKVVRIFNNITDFSDSKPFITLFRKTFTRLHKAVKIEPFIKFLKADPPKKEKRRFYTFTENGPFENTFKRVLKDCFKEENKFKEFYIKKDTTKGKIQVFADFLKEKKKITNPKLKFNMNPSIHCFEIPYYLIELQKKNKLSPYLAFISAIVGIFLSKDEAIIGTSNWVGNKPKPKLSIHPNVHRLFKKSFSKGIDFIKQNNPEAISPKNEESPEEESLIFGKTISLKKMCKKLGVRLTVKRGGKRVYKSVKVLKKQCKTAMKRKASKRKGRFGMGVALKYGPKVAEMLPLIAEEKYIGALKKIEPIEKGIKALSKQLNRIAALQNMPKVFTKFMNPLLSGLKTDLAGQEKFTQTEKKIEETKEQLKKMGEDEVKLKADYAKIKSRIMMKVPPNKDIKEMQKIINLPPFIPVKKGLRKSLPSALLLFLIEDKEEPKTNEALAKFTVAKIAEAVKKATSFGKRKKGLSASLKRMCKKHGVRLMVKRGKKRVYKSSKVLKEQCQNKLKNKLKKNKKKNFGRKKIKRSGIMPPRRKTRGKKRRKQKGGAAKLAQILKASARRQAKRAGRGARSAARYARRNPRRTAGYAAAGLAGLGALGLGGLEASRARGRYLMDREGERMAQNPYGSRENYTDFQARRAALESPTAAAFRRGRRGVTATRDYFNDPNRDMRGDISRGARGAYRGARKRARGAYTGFRNLFKRKQTPSQGEYGKRRRKRSSYKFGDKHENKPNGSPSCGHTGHTGYGKRRRRRRKSKYDFGKKAKKPSAATKRMCKRLKVRLTVKRGGKRVYKSEAMLKKQCKKAMKRKKKRSKK